MAITKFIPEIWSAKLLTSLKKATVYAQLGVVNRDYEGEIAEKGDTVRITSISRPTIAPYVKGTTVIAPEQLTDAESVLTIDQAQYFAFEVDDVDARQAAGNLIPEAMSESAYGLRDVADQYVASLYTGAHASNQISTTTVDDGDKAYAQLIALKVKLDEADVPDEDRWCVIPPWYHGLLLGNNKFVDASAYGSTRPIRNGEVGEAAGFTLLKSNNVPVVTGDDYAVMAGYRGAISYAEQINKTEAFRPESSFSDAVKGLHLYGAKLVRPKGIATLVASKT